MKKYKEKIPGGLAEGMKPSEFDPIQLKAGIKVEMEHTTDKDIASEIARDHLAEDKDYYIKLKKMESKKSNLKDVSYGPLVEDVIPEEFKRGYPMSDFDFNSFFKADVKGTGAHGGHIVGYTKSGKPIYGAGTKLINAVRSKRDSQHLKQLAHDHSAQYKNFNPLDHKDASDLHLTIAMQAKKEMKAAQQHGRVGHGSTAAYANRLISQAHRTRTNTEKSITPEEAFILRDLGQSLNIKQEEKVVNKSLPNYWSIPSYEGSFDDFEQGE
jgi:hypothetical protein